MRRIPEKRLPDPELNALIARAQAGEVPARDEVISCMLRLVASRASRIVRLYDCPELLDDMIQAGVIGVGPTTSGLLRAIQLFDAAAGVPFAAYATSWIDEGIRRGVLADHPVYGRDVAIRIRRVWRIHDRLRKQLDRDPTAEEVHAQLGARRRDQTPEWVRSILANPFATCALGDMQDGTPDTSAHLPDVDECDVAEAIDQSRDLRRLDRAVNDLHWHEREVLRAHFEEDLTLQEIADRMGFSRQYVGQLKAKALTKLRDSRLLRARA